MSSFRNWDYRKAKGAARSPKQRAALDRSFRIFRLRGLWHNLAMLSPERRAAAQALVDADLADLGAEPEADRWRTKRKAYEAEFRRHVTIRKLLHGEPI